MSEASHPPTLLTPSGTRAVASTMCRGAVPGLPAHTYATVVDALDALTGALLVTTLGMTPNEARVVLDYLWAAREITEA